MSNPAGQSTQVSIVAGAIVALRLFDVAYAIDLAQAEMLWLAQGVAPARRGKLAATPEKAISFGVAPILITLDPIDVDMGDGRCRAATVSARCYDFGVIALAIRVPVSQTTWDDYVADVQALDQTMGQIAAKTLWENILAQTLTVITPALNRPSQVTLEEDFLLAMVQVFSEPLTAQELQRRVDLTVLLSGEQKTLSEVAQKDLLRHSHSYFTDDLVVLTWDRAFIYEPRGDSDVADVLEVANAQLVEMRYYDELLDAELPHMYDSVEQTRRTFSLFAARRFAHLARRLYTLVAEVTELTEKVDNALQVTEDIYLARIYSAALDLYRVPKLSAAVDRKLAIVRDTYAALYDEASNSRAELMELSIIFLILVEIGLALTHL